jgi:hypothetical protein
MEVILYIAIETINTAMQLYYLLLLQLKTHLLFRKIEKPYALMTSAFRMKYNMARKLGNFKLSHIENYYYSLVDK